AHGRVPLAALRWLLLRCGHLPDGAGHVLSSLAIWPPLDVFPEVTADTMMLFISFAGAVYFTAMALVLPIAGFMLLSDICIAFLARTAPSLNALTLGMPIKSAVLIVMLIFYIGVLFPKVRETLAGALELLKQVLGA